MQKEVSCKRWSRRQLAKSASPGDWPERIQLKKPVDVTRRESQLTNAVILPIISIAPIIQYYDSVASENCKHPFHSDCPLLVSTAC